MVVMEASLTWFMCSLLSSPWALIFRYRARRAREQGGLDGTSASHVGAVLLVFFTCALMILGFAATVYPANFADPANRVLPLYGFFMATAGVGLSVASDQLARRLGVQKPIRAILELVLVLGSMFGIAAMLSSHSLLQPADHPSFSTPDTGIWCGFAVMEALAALIWLVRSERREHRDAGKFP
jgi:hypothetical protein